MSRPLGIVGFMILLMLGAPVARADGYRVQNTIDTRAVVKRSKLIFTAKVIKVRKKYARRRAYGKNRRYVTAYMAEVKLEKVLRGGEALGKWYKGYRRDLARAKRRRKLKRGHWLWKWRHVLRTKTLSKLWVTQETISVPGRWVSVRDHYPGTYGLAIAKAGDRIVVYLRGQGYIDLKGWRLHARSRYLDSVKIVPRLRKIIRSEVAAERLGWRSNLRCKKLDFWVFRKRCRHQNRIQRLVRCPKGAVMKLKATRLGLRGRCTKPGGKAHGVYLDWHRQGGYLRFRQHWRNGVRHGLRESWKKEGVRASITCFKAGKQVWSTTKPAQLPKRRCP